jgi:hypothetical protein
MYDEKRLHREVAPRMLELGVVIDDMLESTDGDLFRNRLERKPVSANKTAKTVDAAELKPRARPRPRKLRAREGSTDAP